VERRRVAYWRRSWDFLNSGGLWEGGWEAGYRAMGGEPLVICSWEAAGVIAAVVAYCRRIFKGRLHLRIEAIALEGGAIRGGILNGISV